MKLNTRYVFVIISLIVVIFVCCVYASFFATSNRLNREGFDRPWHEYVDVIYYMNLDERPDKKMEFLNEMRRMGVPDEKIVRISAVKKPGQEEWGHSLSHVITMEYFLDTFYDNCIVFEDDFVFTQELPVVNEMFGEVFRDARNFDVIMLSANEIDVNPTDYKYLKKVVDAQTASGYMVNRFYAQTLFLNFKEGAKLVEQSYGGGKSDALQGPFSVDQYWKRLQPQSNWFAFSPKLGGQRESDSESQGGVENNNI